MATAREEQGAAERQADNLEEAEEEARRASTELLATQRAAAAKAEVLEEQAQVGASALEAAREAGLLGASEDPIDALRRARGNADSAVEALAAARQRRVELADLLATARGRAESATEVARESAHAANAAADRFGAGSDERAALTAQPLAIELVGAGTDLELVGAELGARLRARGHEHRGAAIRAAAEAEDDRRAASSLEVDRLLPARREVDTLCARLHDGGIRSAVPGWRYLAQAIPAVQHGAAIERNPALVDGIVVVDAEFDAARELLADAGPAAAIVLGAGSVLAASERTADAGTWVIPPDPALFDPSVAESALELRHAKLATAEERISLESAAERTAVSLAENVERHLEKWPVGVLERAGAEAAALHEAATAAQDALDSAVAHRDETATMVTAAEQAAEQAQETKERSTRLLDRLAELERHSTAALSAARQAEALRAEAGRALAEADAAETTRVNAQRDAAGWRDRAQRAANTASGIVRSLRDLPDPGVAPDDAAQLAAATLAELESRYEEATRLLGAATSESELARRLGRVDEALGDLSQRLDALEADLLARATDLATTPHAADELSRSAAERAAPRAPRSGRRGACHCPRRPPRGPHTARAGLPEPQFAVTLELLPQSPTELATLAAAAERRAEIARQERMSADEELRRVRELHSRLTATQTLLSSTRHGLEVLLGVRVPAPAAAFSGDSTAAVSAAIERLRVARADLEATTSAEHDAVREVTAFAREPRWATLTGELPARLHGEDPDVLAADAEGLCAQVRLKMDRLRDDIEKLDQHRELLLGSLASAVSAANASLRRARNQSQMPPGLGAWSGHPFLKVAVALPNDAAELHARLRRFTNDLVERAAAASLPREAALVCQALLACTEREVSVEVLKPNKAQRLVYVPIAELAPLSGGMRATAAIALFCTLARVRASNQGGRIGVGTLILDNPLGEASSTYLVALQRLMAQKNGVQLLYTSAVNDYDAIRLFPVVSRLNNEAGRKSQLSYVVADPTFLKQLAGGDGDSSLVIGSRLVRRVPVQLTFDVLAAAAEQLNEDP